MEVYSTMRRTVLYILPSLAGHESASLVVTRFFRVALHHVPSEYGPLQILAHRIALPMANVPACTS